MADSSQISGKHNAIFEAYYKQVDPKGVGVIEALDAAKFLKKSSLSDVVLSRIWDLSDPTGKGYLDKHGLFVALKLVALAQAGHEIHMRNIYLETNPPKVGDIPKITPPRPVMNTDWSMKPSDRSNYEKLFHDLKPVNGLIPGNKVKGVLMDSKLPLETLGKIWDLADQDKDGSLDKHEFIVAMHLVYQALAKRSVPNILPPELQRPAAETSTNNGFGSNDDSGFIANFPKEMAPPPVPPLPIQAVPPVIPPLPRVPPTIPSVPSMDLISTDVLMMSAPPTHVKHDWVVTANDKLRYDEIFHRSDIDRDGLVSGLEIKDVFLKSGIPQNYLALIWALCDTNQSGKLTSEQFALAMWFVERKKNGIDPPQVLTSEMIPPSLRTSNDLMSSGGISTTTETMQPQYSNPELEMISKEIEELAKERRVLENDIAQKEADIRIKSGEVRSLQSELDTLAATLKQLENQKGEAQKRLDDLKTQVNKIREQCQKQESTIKDQETEIESKRSELQKLKDEENSLEKQYDESLKELECLSGKLQDTQLQISQVKAMVSQLQENQRQMNDALAMCKIAIEESNPSMVSDYSLKLEPDFREVKQSLEEKSENAFQQQKNSFDRKDSFKSNGFSADPFSNTNGHGFDDGFSTGGGAVGGFDDSFGGSHFNANKNDPFASASISADPFGDKKNQAVTPDPTKDEFGSDPFAILHAPTSASQIVSPSPSQGYKSGPPPRPESPSPALPPKKAKQPPPRPAPPRPLQGPTPTKSMTPSEMFGDSSSSGGFADFASFETKKVDDFVEDPFKNYRYEDPFSIKDPFADDEDEVDPFTESSSTIQNELPRMPTPTPIKTKNNNITKKVFNSEKEESFQSYNKTVKNDMNSNQTDFASFDAFNSNTNSSNSDSDFFETFNDNFNKNSNTKKSSIVDAFGDDKTTAKINPKNFSSTFDDFDDEFANLQINPTTTSVSNNKFSKFDKFGKNNLLSNENAVSKVKNKFNAEDFSKNDNFDTDLEEVLKRSLVDK